MNLLQNRTDNQDTILKGRFVRMKLQEAEKGIEKEQDRRMAGFNSAFWRDRTFSITDNSLELEELKVHRFIDMRTRTKKDGTKIKKKSHPIYNKVVMGQYNQLTKELAYGFTEEIKTLLRNLK